MCFCGTFKEVTSFKKKPFFLFFQFQVHKTILQASCPQINWSQTPPPLTNTSEETLATILHFIYAECLPDDMSEDKAKQCKKVAGKLPGLEKLLEQCESFLQNIAVKNRKYNCKSLN